MEGHNFESNIFKESDAFHINPSGQDQEEEEALEDQRRRNEELHDLLEGAFIDITNDNSEDDSDFQSTFNATESANGLQNGQWNESECESNGNLYVDTPQSVTTPTYDASSTREYYDEGISHSNVDSPLSDSNQQQNQLMQHAMKPRRRYWSTQHVSSLTPLKEIDNVHVESDGDVEQQMIDEYNDMEIADTKQLALMYQARVRDCEKLARRVSELEETLKTEIQQKDTVIHQKEMELDNATMTFGANKALLIEAQQKVKEYKAIVDEVTKERDVIKTEKTKMEYELENTRRDLVEAENNAIYTKSKINEDHATQINKINSKHKDEIKKFQNIIDDQATKLQDMQKRITDLTHVNDNLMTNQYDLTKRMNNIMDELTIERENLRRANEEMLQMKDVVSERDLLKRKVKDLEEKLNELLYEISKIQKEKCLSRRDKCAQTDDISLPSNQIETELKRSLESLRMKRDEIVQMKQIISEQQQMIAMLSAHSQGVSTECQTSEESANQRNQGEQTDLLSNDIHKYKSQLAILEQEISQKDVDLNRYRHKLQKLENDFDELKRSDTTTINDYNRLHQDYEKLASDYQKRGETINILQKELEALRNDFISFQETSTLQTSPAKDTTNGGEDSNNYQQLIDTIRNELQVMSNKNKNIKTSLLDKANELVQVTEENQELRQKIMELETVQHDKCHEEIVALRNSLEIRNQNSEAFQTIIENLKIKLREAEERLIQVCDLENTNKSLRKQLNRNNNNYDSVRNEIHAMRNSLVKFIGEQLTDMEENFDCSNTEEELLRQLASLKHIYEKIISSKSQVIQVQLLEIQKLQAEIEKYRNFDKEVREAIETQISVLKTACEEKMANAKMQCYIVLDREEDSQQTTSPEKISEDSTTVDRINALVAQVNCLKFERDKYLKASGMVNELMYRIQIFEEQNARLISELEHANQDLEVSKQRINSLQNHEATIVSLQKQIKELKLVIKQYNKNKATYAGSPEIKELQQQLVTIQTRHSQEIEQLQTSLKDVMKQEIETIQTQFHKKIISLESEKQYLENCLRSVEEHSKEMIQKCQQEKANLNAIIEVNVAKLNEMNTKIANFDQREIDWKEKETALLKEKRTLTKGLDKFAKAMLELYIKHKHMTGEIKRMKEEKHSCFEYAYCLKKKLNQLKDQATCPGTTGATTSSQTRARRSLSESSTPLNTTALQINQHAMKKSSSSQHNSRSAKKIGNKLPISSVKLKINSKASYKRATPRINTSSLHMHSSSSLDAPQVVEAYRNRNRIRKSSVSKD
ncbi:major antigen-like isoform X2 [Chrysoperla carnea]|uniref:major antigen-like isoform X2 n=1 Tax=Chrysoperla carnea TaxID=189513 RepID=UPI001D0644A0|nr:major antigen-like isoform X2 [Chrysoperla carnea]